jgi:hypothetical protein
MSAVKESHVKAVSPMYSLTFGILSIQALRSSKRVGERWSSSTRLPGCFLRLLFPIFMVAPGPET